MKEKRGYLSKCRAKMEGKKSRGSTRTRWMEPNRKDLEIRGENWEEIQGNRK